MATKRKPKKKPVRKRRTTKEPVLTKLKKYTAIVNIPSLIRSEAGGVELIPLAGLVLNLALSSNSV